MTAGETALSHRVDVGAERISMGIPKHIRELADGPAGEWVRVSLPPMAQLHAAGLPSTIESGHRNNHHSAWISRFVCGDHEMQHLWIRRHDGRPIRSWAVMQRIKNELVGADRTAVEVFPSAADVVDDAPMYHLWVFPLGYRLPFGLQPGVPS